MRITVTALLFFCLTVNIQAQNSPSQPVKFSEKSFDFYAVKEGGGNVSHTFYITNTAENEARIIHCGIDSQWKKNIRITWDKKPFGQYGRTGIHVTMNPKGLRNHIQIPVHCRVLSGKDTIKQKLLLKAYIQAIPTKIEDKYNMQEGHLKIENNTISFARMGRTETKRDTIMFYNVWDSVMTFKVGKLPESVKVEYLTPKVKPEKEGMMVISFHAEAVNDWGSVLEKFSIITNDPLSRNRNGRKNFFVLAEIYDDFRLWSSEQMENAPHILTEEEEYNFGNCTSGEEITHSFTVTNIGKSDLIIRKIKSSCGCTTSKLEKETIKPGESTFIKVTFNTYNKIGSQSKEIYVYTNDPQQPQTTLKITGHIK